MNADGGRVLALDLGEVRIGLALSDPLGITAQPLKSMHRVGPRKDLAFVEQLIRDRSVSKVVVGHPLLLSGEEGSAAAACRDFAERLQRRIGNIEVALWDERLSTVEAERTLIAGDVRRSKRKNVIDALAAVLILQNYLDAQTARPGDS